MSDSLYQAELRNKIRPKPKGLLQFGQSSLDRYGQSLNYIQKAEKPQIGYMRSQTYTDKRIVSANERNRE